MAIQDSFAQLSYPILLAVICSVVVVHIFYTAIYRLYLHPLAKYPGPFWAKLSTWPSYWATLKLDRHVWLYQLQQEYEGYKAIFGPKGNIKKTESYYRVWPHSVDITNTWNATNISAHARKRRVLNQAFSDRVLRGAEPLVHSNANRWLHLMKREAPEEGEWTKPPNMADQANYLVFDILGDLCFGKSFDMKEPSSDLRNIPKLMGSFLELMHPIAFSPRASWWMWMKPRGLDWLLQYAVPSDMKKRQSFVASNLEKRTKKEQELKNSDAIEGNASKDFFHYLFDAKDPETGKAGYDLGELWGECKLLTIAGSDTTAIVTAAMTFYLAKNPSMQAKLAKEIMTAFPSYDDIVGGSKLHECKYLRAFIQETLRMAPPVPADLEREVLPGGTTIEDQYFPQDVQVSTCLYCLSYNEGVFREPFTFRPERFLDTMDEPLSESTDKVALAESGLCAFSTGSCGCVGKNLAWLELQIILTKMVYTSELKQDPSSSLDGGSSALRPGHEHEDQYQLWDAFVAMRVGPMIQFKETLS